MPPKKSAEDRHKSGRSGSPGKKGKDGASSRTGSRNVSFREQKSPSGQHPPSSNDGSWSARSQDDRRSLGAEIGCPGHNDPDMDITSDVTKKLQSKACRCKKFSSCGCHLCDIGKSERSAEEEWRAAAAAAGCYQRWCGASASHHSGSRAPSLHSTAEEAAMTSAGVSFHIPFVLKSVTIDNERSGRQFAAKPKKPKLLIWPEFSETEINNEKWVRHSIC
uniref:RNA helicase n=1 Tax=Macrostomum lignano TaxID=282301 RepID=A0A1I8JRV1_9PLAT